MSGSLRVTVLGAAGLAAGELLRLLSLHPRVESIRAISASGAGRPASTVHPALLHLPPIPLVDLPISAAVADADVVFCALPHGKSGEAMPAIAATSAHCIIDLAMDFRPGAIFADDGLTAIQSAFVYGLTEAFSERIATARFVANPGCFATAAELLLLPLMDAQVSPDRFSIFAVTGSSGAGILPKATTHHPLRDGNLFAYKMLEHQHEPEIDYALSTVAGRPIKARLMAHSGPFVRGIHATVYLHDDRMAAVDLPTLYADYFDERRPFVLVLDRPPQVAEVAATNFVHVHVKQKGPEAVIALALDNLVKGAAGQAIENMNLMMGLPVQTGLTHPGAFPC